MKSNKIDSQIELIETILNAFELKTRKLKKKWGARMNKKGRDKTIINWKTWCIFVGNNSNNILLSFYSIKRFEIEKMITLQLLFFLLSFTFTSFSCPLRASPSLSNTNFPFVLEQYLNYKMKPFSPLLWRSRWDRVICILWTRCL